MKRLLVTMVVCAGLAAFVAACGGSSTDSTGSTSTSTTTATPSEILTLINNQRAAASASALTYDSNIEAVAQDYADYLASVNRTVYSETADGQNIETRLTAGSVSYSVAGETGAINTTADTASEAVNAMSSSVLTDPSYGKVGVGSANFTDLLYAQIKKSEEPEPDPEPIDRKYYIWIADLTN